MTSQFVSVFADLLDTSSEGIEVLYREIEIGKTPATFVMEERCDTDRTLSEMGGRTQMIWVGVLPCCVTTQPLNVIQCSVGSRLSCPYHSICHGIPWQMLTFHVIKLHLLGDMIKETRDSPYIQVTGQLV
jgi:hypothetical protein